MIATIDEEGKVTDRRAGRISSEKNKELCRLLEEKIEKEGIELFIKTVKEHRAVVIFRGTGLSDELNDSDPQVTGVPPREIKALCPKAEKAAEIVRNFLRRAKEVLRGHHPANMVQTSPASFSGRDISPPAGGYRCLSYVSRDSQAGGDGYIIYRREN